MTIHESVSLLLTAMTSNLKIPENQLSKAIEGAARPYFLFYIHTLGLMGGALLRRKIHKTLSYPKLFWIMTMVTSYVLAHLSNIAFAKLPLFKNTSPFTDPSLIPPFKRFQAFSRAAKALSLPFIFCGLAGFRTQQNRPLYYGIGSILGAVAVYHGSRYLDRSESLLKSLEKQIVIKQRGLDEFYDRLIKILGFQSFIETKKEYMTQFFNRTLIQKHKKLSKWNLETIANSLSANYDLGTLCNHPAPGHPSKLEKARAYKAAFAPYTKRFETLQATSDAWGHHPTTSETYIAAHIKNALQESDPEFCSSLPNQLSKPELENLIEQLHGVARFNCYLDQFILGHSPFKIGPYITFVYTKGTYQAVGWDDPLIRDNIFHKIEQSIRWNSDQEAGSMELRTIQAKLENSTMSGTDIKDLAYQLFELERHCLSLDWLSYRLSQEPDASVASILETSKNESSLQTRDHQTLQGEWIDTTYLKTLTVEEAHREATLMATFWNNDKLTQLRSSIDLKLYGNKPISFKDRWCSCNTGIFQDWGDVD